MFFGIVVVGGEMVVIRGIAICIGVVLPFQMENVEGMIGVDFCGVNNGHVVFVFEVFARIKHDVGKIFIGEKI